MPRKPRRVYVPPPDGLDPAKTAPYWNGVRAEQIVAQRVKQYAKEKAVKDAKRRKKRT